MNRIVSIHRKICNNYNRQLKPPIICLRQGIKLREMPARRPRFFWVGEARNVTGFLLKNPHVWILGHSPAIKLMPFKVFVTTNTWGSDGAAEEGFETQKVIDLIVKV